MTRTGTYRRITEGATKISLTDKLLDRSYLGFLGWPQEMMPDSTVFREQIHRIRSHIDRKGHLFPDDTWKLP